MVICRKDSSASLTKYAVVVELLGLNSFWDANIISKTERVVYDDSKDRI